jgi:pilus assembly protein Flp/PilA
LGHGTLSEKGKGFVFNNSWPRGCIFTFPRFGHIHALVLQRSAATASHTPENALDPRRKNSEEKTTFMMTFVLSSLARLHQDEEGQGLVEYILIVALVAFAATAGMSRLASSINSAFSALGSLVGTYIT